MIKEIKKKINYWMIRNGKNYLVGYKLLIKVNNKLFHRTEKFKKVSMGNLNEDKVFFVIQLTDRDGIFSTLRTALMSMKWAEENSYIPIIDMISEKEREGDGSFYRYFASKVPYSLDTVYKSKNVILSGVENYPNPSAGFGFYHDAEAARIMKRFIDSHIGFSKEVLESVEKEQGELNWGDTLGVFLRGTDYTAMEPYWHPKQPPVEEVIDKVKIFMQTHTVSRVYLVTEDWKIYTEFKRIFGKLLYITGGEKHFIKNYNGKAYIADYISDKYTQNLEYITRIILLARCRWLIASITNGSRMAIWLNGDTYEETYLFEKGYYRVEETQ